MRFATYRKWTGIDWDDLDLQQLMEALSEYLLESGFQRQFREQMRAWLTGQEPGGEEDEDNPLASLREAIRQALLESSLLDHEQYQQLFDAQGNARDEQLAQLIDSLIERLVEEGFLSVQADGEVVDWSFERDEQGRIKGIRPRSAPGEESRYSGRTLRFALTRKGTDFLGYKSLQRLLGSFGKASFGSHRTETSATGVEAYEAPKVYEFGDSLQLDPSESLRAALMRQGVRLPLELEYEDLRVRQSEYLSSCATVVMLDCSHSMVLYGEDRFTPAKQVALALAHLIRTQFPGDSIRFVLFHDSAEEVPYAKLGQVEVGPYHTNTCEGLRLARRILLSQQKEMRQIIMITDGKPSALFVGEPVYRQGKGGDLNIGRRLYKNSFGLDPMIIEATLAEAAECRRSRIMVNTFMLTDDQYLVAFVRQLTEIAQGKAYFTSVSQVGQYVLYDFLRRRVEQIR